MGVSGCGKSTVGALLGERLGMPFQDGDDLHPAANKAKMSGGIALDDADRLPWLDRIGEVLHRSQEAQKPLIIACSALKRSYRDLLRKHVNDLVCIHLAGDRETLVARMNARAHEFMPASLLDSQLSTLEPLTPDERHILADLTHPTSRLLDEICSELRDFAAV